MGIKNRNELNSKYWKRKLKKLIKAIRLDCVFGRMHWISKNPFFLRLVPDQWYYADGESRVVRRRGAKFELYPRDFSQWLLFSGQEDKHIEAAISYLKPNISGIIVDVGANVGQFCIQMACVVKRNQWNKRIIAFEPNPMMAARLVRNMEINEGVGNIIELKDQGVGNRNDKMRMQVPSRNSGAGSLVRGYLHEKHNEIVVNVDTLDSLIDAQDMGVEFVKIDVEGFELKVLEGAIGIIEKWRPVFYIEILRDVSIRKMICDFFSIRNYICFKETREGFIKTNLLEMSGNNHLENFLFVFDQQLNFKN